MNLAETPAADLRISNVVQIEPVGRRLLAPRSSPLAHRTGVRAVTPPAFMAFDRFCRLVEALVPPLELHLGGEDEPLLHPRFFDMVAYAAAKGLEVSATTALPGLTADRAEECVDSGLKRLHVVLAGRPTPLQERSLRRLEEAKRRLGSRSPELLLSDKRWAPTASERYGFHGQRLPAALTAAAQ